MGSGERLFGEVSDAWLKCDQVYYTSDGLIDGDNWASGSDITRYSSTGIAMVFVFSPYIWKCFHFQVILIRHSYVSA